MGGLSNQPISDPDTASYPKPRVEKSSFQISANQLVVHEKVNRAHFRIHRLVVKWYSEQSYNFRQSPKWVKADWTQYAQSSSGLTTIVVMTLLDWDNSPAIPHANCSFDKLRLLCSEPLKKASSIPFPNFPYRNTVAPEASLFSSFAKIC